MAIHTVNLTTQAYDRLKRFKQPGQSFSDVVMEVVPSGTCGDLLDSLEEFRGKRLSDPDRMKTVREGRGRRSPRRSRQ
jgi:predicted CopG family antitoxin